ncbi:MAG: hypothetical protein P4L43_17260 [Syntrophobacteraceae bacterium]|nr:hypothetical protein [Syntrophobacteraceae bacterium]
MVSNLFNIIDVSEFEQETSEPLGSKHKFWFDSNRLFKVGRENTGENWTEKVADELCNLLEIPHASYHFAIWRGINGVVTRSVVPAGGRLILGNELLSVHVGNYPRKELRGVNQYMLTNVLAILSIPTLQPPMQQGFPADLNSALDIFVGYLMLDALIANQDRHHEN